MARRPFKKYRSKNFIEAVQLSEDNIQQLERQLGGEIETGLLHNEVTGVNDETVQLRIPTLSGVIGADLGDWVFYDEKNRIRITTDEAFNDLYHVPKVRANGEEEEDDDDDELEDADEV